MQLYQDYFWGKRVTLMGLGLLGRGVGDAEFLAPLVKELIVTDKKTVEELAPSLDRLKRFTNISYTLGEHKLEDFQSVDLVIKAAGVPLDSPYITAAKKNNIPVRMSADLFAQFAGIPVVGVTGTRGKSTVTYMIAHILEMAGKEVVLGGNVRGVSTLSLLSNVTPSSIAVLELDSWQLQGFGEAKISPHIAVFTNLKQDHLNYYPTEELYFADKANIFKYQKSGDVLIAGRVVTDIWIRAAQPPIPPKVPSVGNWRLKIIGEHNRENASLAAEAARALAVSEEDITSGLESFEPVEGRLQLIREVGGVKIYNDNNATTPDAIIAALAAFAPEKPVLITGGADKKLLLETLAHMLPECVRAIVFLEGTGTSKLLPLVESQLQANKVPYVKVDSMDDAVRNAETLAQHSGSILFSPAFASFGMFKNEYDRNDQFVAAVSKLS